MNGGDAIAAVLAAHGVKALFTLCGGHISPILLACKQQGIRVVDVRHEASAVFAADATARLTGVPGVAAVTAGPGVTNSITALQNAAMAQTPLLLLGGATATVLKGRGSLQDIDQLPLVNPMVKFSETLSRVRDLAPAVREALRTVQSDVQGPAFLECPVDLLYPEETVREWYSKEAGGGSGLKGKAVAAYLKFHLDRVFGGNGKPETSPLHVDPLAPGRADLKKAARRLARAERPLLVVGSQALAHPQEAEKIATAIRTLGIPVYLGGGARGLLGRTCGIQFRHQRRQALREADVVLVMGFPFDFRMGYGRHIRSKATVISVNRSLEDLSLNRKADLAVRADPGRFLQGLGEMGPPPGRWTAWLEQLREREIARDEEIERQAAEPTDHVNPLHLCRRIEEHLEDNSLLVVDGGDFVATAAYIVRPRGPLSWLDPGVFGTLGVGGGFAVGAAVSRPESRVWLLYGDGSSAYSLAEFDTFVRHGLPVIAVVGTDASWAQIAREQVDVLGDPVGTELRRTDYHKVAEGYGGKGLLLERPEQVDEVLAEAKRLADEGSPVLINAQIGAVDFRKGSISI